MCLIRFLKNYGFILAFCMCLQGCGYLIGGCMLIQGKGISGPLALNDGIQVPREDGKKGFVDTKEYTVVSELEGEKNCLLTGCGFAKLQITKGQRTLTYRFPIEAVLGNVDSTEDGGTLEGFTVTSEEDRSVTASGQFRWGMKAPTTSGTATAGGASGVQKFGYVSGRLYLKKAGKHWLRLNIKKDIPLEKAPH